jgi:uncharacterized protein (TIGR02266 family)
MTEKPSRKQSLPPNGKEQRAHHRTELQVEVTLTSDSHFFVGLTNDISNGGLFVSTYKPLEVGAKIELEFALPEGTIRTKGTVRWRRESSEVGPGVGISFDELTPETAKMIQRFCASRPPLYYDLDE